MTVDARGVPTIGDVGMFHRRDIMRRCLRCGYEWRVPRALAKRYRPSKWRVGIAPADHYGMRGAQFDESIRYQLDSAKTRSGEAMEQMALTDSLRQCSRCGSSAYTQRKAADSAPPGGPDV